MKLKTNITTREKYESAMSITDQAAADAYFEECVAHSVAAGNARSEAERVERMNLGYYAGYYDLATRERVERLFRCVHPVFGAVAVNGAPTAEQAWTAGFVEGVANIGPGGGA